MHSQLQKYMKRYVNYKTVFKNKNNFGQVWKKKSSKSEFVEKKIVNMGEFFCAKSRFEVILTSNF